MEVWYELDCIYVANSVSKALKHHLLHQWLFVSMWNSVFMQWSINFNDQIQLRDEKVYSYKVSNYYFLLQLEIKIFFDFLSNLHWNFGYSLLLLFFVSKNLFQGGLFKFVKPIIDSLLNLRITIECLHYFQWIKKFVNFKASYFFIKLYQFFTV
jgi:hypothetical protein